MDYANGLQPSRIKLEIRHSHRLCWPRAGPGGGGVGREERLWEASGRGGGGGGKEGAEVEMTPP